jgi:hypothetical protein
MLRLSVILAAILFLASPASSQTISGRVEPNVLQRHTFTPSASGQFLATVSWDSTGAQLLLILVCTVEGKELSYGIASGLLERFARLESGILRNYPCQIGVMTATSSANYTLNLQRSNAEPSTQQPAMPLSRKTVATVIPGTDRGDELDRIAFRLQRAVNP